MHPQTHVSATLTKPLIVFVSINVNGKFKKLYVRIEKGLQIDTRSPPAHDIQYRTEFMSDKPSVPSGRFPEPQFAKSWYCHGQCTSVSV